METIKKCKISRYDETITKPPYLTIQIDKMDVVEPEADHLGEELCRRLYSSCSTKGYLFRFYTTSSDDEYNYEVVVY